MPRKKTKKTKKNDLYQSGGMFSAARAAGTALSRATLPRTTGAALMPAGAGATLPRTTVAALHTSKPMVPTGAAGNLTWLNAPPLEVVVPK